MYEFLVIAGISSVVNGVPFDRLYRVYAKRGISAIVAFLRDTGGVEGSIYAFCIDGLQSHKLVSARLMGDDLIISGVTGELHAVEFSVKVEQQEFMF